MELIVEINYVMLRGERFAGVIDDRVQVWDLRERFADKHENRDFVTSSLLVDPPSSFGSL